MRPASRRSAPLPSAPAAPVRSALLALAAVFLAGLASGCAPHFEPAGPAIRAPAIAAGSAKTGTAETARIETARIETADGASLPARSWLPAGTPPKAVILALHGFNDYSNAFDLPGTYWAKHGVATFAYDQRGFGAGPHPGIWSDARTLADDAATAAALLGARYPGVPLYLLGESMGGAVAIVAAAETGLEAQGVVLVAPALRGRRYLGFLPRATLWLTSRLFPWYPLTGEGLNIRPSDNIPMLRAFAADPLVIKETRIDAIRGLVDLMDRALDDAPRLSRPTLFLYGDRDELIPEGPTFDTIRDLPAKAHPKAAVYRTGWHMLLRDLAAMTVWDDVLAWIADHGAPLPSGADRAAARAIRGYADGDGSGHENGDEK